MSRARSEPGGTRWRTAGEVKGKLASGVGSQYSHATSERGLSSITQADVHKSAASSRLNWRPHRFKWTRPFRGKTKYDFCVCVITFRTSFTRDFSWGKGGRCVRLTTYHPRSAERQENQVLILLGTPWVGDLYLYLTSVEIYFLQSLLPLTTCSGVSLDRRFSNPIFVSRILIQKLSNKFSSNHFSSLGVKHLDENRLQCCSHLHMCGKATFSVGLVRTCSIQDKWPYRRPYLTRQCNAFVRI